MRTQQPPPPSRLKPVLGGILVGLLGILVVGHLVGGWYVSGLIREQLFAPRSADGAPFADPPDAGDGGAPDLERVTYPSPLGDMAAWYLPGTRSQWILHVHGEGASLSEVLPLMEDLDGIGFPQLAITYRNDPGEPADPSGMLGWGLTEWADLRAAIDYAVSRGASGVVVVGHSGGAAITLATLYRDDTDVLGAILVSPVIDLSTAVDAWADRTDLALGLPIPPTLLAMGKLFTELRLDLDWTDVDFAGDAERLQVPVLVLHGTADATAPIETSRALVERRPQLVTLVEVEGAGHGEAPIVGGEASRRAVLGFLIEVAR